MIRTVATSLGAVVSNIVAAVVVRCFLTVNSLLVLIFFRVPFGGHLKFDVDRFWQKITAINTLKNGFLMRIQPRGTVNVLISTAWPVWGRPRGAAAEFCMPRPSKRDGRGFWGGGVGEYNLYYKHSPHEKRIHLRASHSFSCCLFDCAPLKHRQLQQSQETAPHVWPHPLRGHPQHCHCLVQSLVSSWTRLLNRTRRVRTRAAPTS